MEERMPETRIAVIEDVIQRLGPGMLRLEAAVQDLVAVTARQGAQINSLKWSIGLALPLAVAVATSVLGLIKA